MQLCEVCDNVTVTHRKARSEHLAACEPFLTYRMLAGDHLKTQVNIFCPTFWNFECCQMFTIRSQLGLCSLRVLTSCKRVFSKTTLLFSRMGSQAPYLNSLNGAQHRGSCERPDNHEHVSYISVRCSAVTHDPKVPLQIFAGPGSGTAMSLCRH
jgi:hypothetical protein